MSEALAAMRLDFELGVAKVIAQADQIKKAMGAMGTEGERSGEKFDRATAKMAARVREATIAMEAGGRTSSRYFEALAKSKGQEKALEPLIAKLREVEAAQQRVGGGMAANDAAFNRTGMSARQLSAAMRGVPAQFTDIFTSIQGGQAPLTVLLQQGGQLKDMFGGIGPAVRALGGYLLGLITPLTVLIGVFATMGTALFVGSREWSNFRKEAILTGNTMAMSASQYTTARDAIASIGATRGKATDAMEEIAKNGQIVASSMTLVGQTAVLMEKVAGTKIADTVKAFASLADDPVKASERLNKQTNYLTAAIYEQIRALDEQGKKAQAAALAEQTYADAMQSRATKVQESLGWMERGWNAVAGAAKKAWDFMLNIGRADSPAEKMAKLSQQ
ncbi:MAG: phage tail length tape measure family protein, partial [Rhodocyclaceae bacterium]